MGNMRIGNLSHQVELIRSGYSKEKGTTKTGSASLGGPAILALGQNIGACIEEGVQGQDLSKKDIVAGGYTFKGGSLPLPEITK
ncbi:MAG: hypothetical protein K1060chlam3_00565 [Candidatus Anoxychlamydiales bacterium]|nr:hypothetical protein [Candidatus Anoxychlamydiales bacterium]